MKALAIAAALLASTALVHAGEMKGMDMTAGERSKGTHRTTAVVKKADPKAGTVVLDHEPVKSMNWPAMTMTFQVKDKALMDKLTANRKVEVEFEQRGKDHVITGVK